MSLTVGLLVLACVVGLPGLVIAGIWLRIRRKERLTDAAYWTVHASIRDAGFSPAEDGWFSAPDGRSIRLTISTNPLFSRKSTLRIAAYASTLHEVELVRGRPVPPEFADFAPLLARWDTCGKEHLECYMAAVTDRAPDPADVRALCALAARPLERAYTGGTITIRDGLERDCPQHVWRHDIRARLPSNLQRTCVSYWTDTPLLTPPLARLIYDLAGEGRVFALSDTQDLRFLEAAYPRRDIAIWGTAVELKKPDMLAAADLQTDGGFFGGALVARDVPSAFEEEELPRYRYHELAVGALRKSFFYVRRLPDDENSWYSGEYEFVSAYPLDVRGAVERLARSLGAEVMEIDRRFHKRLVKPLDW